MCDLSKYRREILAVIAGISLLLIFSGCGRRSGYEVLGNVIFLRGTATIRNGKESGHHSKPATVASKLSVGSQLETSPNSIAAVSLIPGIFVEVGVGTEVVIDELRVQKQGDAMVDAMKSRMAKLRMNRGVIHASLPNVGSAQCELNLQTDLGTVVAERGALFSVRLTNGTVRIVCVDGEVQWNSAHDSRADEIPPGYFRDYRRPDVPNRDLKTETTPVTEDAAAQNDIAAALETAAAFDDFALRVRNVRAPKSSRPVEQRPVQPP